MNNYNIIKHDPSFFKSLIEGKVNNMTVIETKEPIISGNIIYQKHIYKDELVGNYFEFSIIEELGEKKFCSIAIEVEKVDKDWSPKMY